MPNSNAFRPVDHEKCFFKIYQHFPYFALLLGQPLYLNNLIPPPKSMFPTKIG